MEYPTGAVVSDHADCSKVGRDILLQDGSTVDAAIATAICNSVLTPQSAGIGGGTFMVIYDKEKCETVYIDAKSAAPRALTSEMFERQKEQDVNARAIGIPGMLKAFKLAHEKYGRLPWRTLFQPAIKILREGFPMSESTEFACYLDSDYGLGKFAPIDGVRFPLLRSIYCSDGLEKRKGDVIFWPNLADTLEGVAEHGPDYIYNSHVTETLVHELRQQGGVHSIEDFQQYNARTGPAHVLNLDDLTLHTVPGASGGPMMTFMLNVLKGCGLSPSDLNSLQSRTEMYHKIIEVIRFMLPIKEQIGDAHLVDIEKILENTTSESYASDIRERITPETHEDEYYSDVTAACDVEHGTSHVSVLSPDGNAVAVTSTINMYFGSRVLSPSTGIIWNNELSVFDTTMGPEAANAPAPGKRPRSSMSPMILTDGRGNVRLVIGAAGGGRIVTVLSQVLVKMLWLKMPIAKAVEEKRFHVNKGLLYLESGFPQELKRRLIEKGHEVTDHLPPFMAVVQTIFVDQCGVIQAYSDKRKRPGGACFVYRYSSELK